MVTVQDTDGTPEDGLHVYVFDGTAYTGLSAITNAAGQVTLTLPQGEYRFRADKPAPGSSGNGTQFWSAAENDCSIPGCNAATVTTTIPVVVTVQDTDGMPEARLHVYAFDGTTYTNYNGVTDASGQVVLTLPQGEYRFRADKNGTQFWSAAENDCAIPGCISAMVETTIPVTVTVLDSGGAPQAGLPVYAFDGTTYTNYSATTDAEGKAVMTLPQGEYRFRADSEGTQYWSGETNHCSIPGCLNAAITVPGGGASLITTTITYTYDGLNRLTAADYDSGEYFHYTYDDVGNRQTEEKKTTPDGIVENTEYTYDDANRMTSAGGVTYAWDDKGNLLDDGVNTYTYNHANKLTMVDGQSSIVVFAYNGLGDRLSESIDGATVIFTLDLNTGLTQVLADDSHVYLYGLGRIAQTAPSEYVYFLGDALGSVRQLVDGQGIVILARAYEPYGRVLSTAGEDVTKYGFTGEWQENGLVFLRNRFYNPNEGRFLSKDALSEKYLLPSYTNRWNYGGANPIIFADPSGNIPCKKPSSTGYVGQYCESLATALLSIAETNNYYVKTGSLLPVEAYAQLVDSAFILSEKNSWGMMWALTAVLNGLDGNSSTPIWQQLSSPNTALFFGEDWLPYKSDQSKNEELWGPNNSQIWRYSERGDWNPSYWDQTANQAYHSWFFVAVTYFVNAEMAHLANYYHEICGAPDGPGLLEVCPISNIGNWLFNFHDYTTNPPIGAPPGHGQSLPDWLLGEKAIEVGHEFEQWRFIESIDPCKKYSLAFSPGDWIRKSFT